MKTTINIKGMHCKSCVNKIEENLSELKGIKKVNVDLVKETADVEYDENKIKLDRIKQEIIDSGYKIAGKDSKKRNFFEALIYGLIPHIGCIAFVLGSIFGATLLMQFFKPLLMNRYFFHALVGISFLFATISAYFYLRKEGFLSMSGIKRKWRYLVTMYGTTIGVNLLLFLLIFPMLANVSVADNSVNLASDSTIIFSVDIPCSGHAPLISEELKTIEGVNSIEYSFPNNFEVSFDSSKTNKQEMLALEVFKEYPATVVDETVGESVSFDSPQIDSVSVGPESCGLGSSGCPYAGSDQKPAECDGSCDGSCGGSCGNVGCAYR